MVHGTKQLRLNLQAIAKASLKAVKDSGGSAHISYPSDKTGDGDGFAPNFTIRLTSLNLKGHRRTTTTLTLPKIPYWLSAEDKTIKSKQSC
ncbi:hypothetical protein H6F98_19440 [Microcoleus sp. FACHB-SPT15]|jgi:hypothetical protein|uniref:hypothetical protein n=1 Tax=Microcoleus sp. FACHB-SPT15 TaxID=2692830 RepID=UPI0017869D39|nr:hypothetical protein [Microcoleus sp. FACHB-SPT15]MBD1807601.1 hypothetical protein [Microcoleus sp. FACHB-SPT15]